MAEAIILHEDGMLTRGRYGYRWPGTFCIDGVPIRLNAQCSDLLGILLAAGDRPVRYKLILEILGCDTNMLANDYVGQLVYKARRVFEKFPGGTPTPIRVWHGYGLCWSGPETKPSPVRRKRDWIHV